MNATTNNSSSGIEQEVLAEDAYKRIEGELLALPSERIETVNLDIPAAAAVAIGKIPRLATLKGLLEEKLQDFDATALDRLEDYTYGMIYAHSMYQCEMRAPEDLQQLLASGIRRREVLYSDAKALALRGLIPEESLQDYDGLIGYINVANDLQMLCTALGSRWTSIAGRCATTREELDFASRMAGRIIRLVGERNQSAAKVQEASDKRARAYTLFFECFDEIRRAVVYVRWYEGDADAYAPSLHTTSHKTRRSDKKAKSPAPSEPETPAQPQPPNQAGQAPVIQSFNNPSPFMPAGSPAPIRNADGAIPGGSPFIQ